MTAEDALSEIVRRLVATAKPKQIILFGSWATGKNRPDSDLDLLVIESEPFDQNRSRLQEIGKLERALGRIPFPTDILVFSESEVERLKTSSFHVVARAIKEGRVLYARH
jgi:predicted nucleotidyltransferase